MGLVKVPSVVYKASQCQHYLLSRLRIAFVEDRDHVLSFIVIILYFCANPWNSDSYLVFSW